MKFRLRLFLVAMPLSAGVCAAVVQESQREAQVGMGGGVVVDKASEGGIASAVVFLKNVRTNAVRSYIADDEGNYRFSGLDPNVDYEIHAEKDGAKSATRTISSFDNKKELVYPLKIEKKKA